MSVSHEDNWMRIFDIPDTSKHKKGFTIYKIISMLYPKNCPDSLTSVTVWKRYNDVKKLYADLKLQHKKLGLKEKFPSLPTTSYFKRFDDETIEERRKSILTLLEFIAAHPQLFMSDVFVKFLKTSYTPQTLLSSNINSIRADLNLPEEPAYNLARSVSEDERTISDSDSISTFSSLSQSTYSIDQLPDPLSPNSTLSMIPEREHSPASLHFLHDTLSVSTALSNDSFGGFATPPRTPNAPSSCSVSSYIVDAAQHLTQAVEFETQRKYEEAFASYKAGIDILLQNVKYEKNVDSREMVRHKTERYLLRAEKIYNLHISHEIKSIRQYSPSEENEPKDVPVKPLSDLYNYKVIKVIASGMLVLHRELQQFFYVKVIQKSTKTTNDKLILPEDVPCMVKLHNYYNRENALFLIMEYCSGKRVLDYLQPAHTCIKGSVDSNCANLEFYTNSDECDHDLESSYSDLINDYKSNGWGNVHSKSDGDIRSIPDRTKESLDNIVTSSLGKSESEIDHTKDRECNGCCKSDMKLSQRTNSERIEVSLFDSVDIDDIPGLPLEKIISWSAQLILALESLHHLGVVCGDLQISNLLTDEDGYLLLSYKCNIKETNNMYALSKKGLVPAPELYNFKPLTESVDWWSFGVILYELLVRIPLSTVHREAFSSYTILKVPKYVSVEGRSLLKQLLTFEPNERLGCGYNGTEDLKSHPFFSSVSWESLLADKK